MEIIKDYKAMDYRFTFVFSVSDGDNKDVTVCKRDFSINNFDQDSLRSIELKECMDDIATMIDKDLKSKTRTLLWNTMNLENNSKQVVHGSEESGKSIERDFNDKIPTEKDVTLKVTLLDGGKEVISKIWSGNGYPKAILWSKNYLTQEVSPNIDLTNKKYKYDTINVQSLDFVKQVAQRSAADKSDLTITIKNHISSVCSSSYSKDGSGKKIIYKQDLPELGYETVADIMGNMRHINNRLEPIDFVENDGRAWGFDRVIYEVYTTNANYKTKNYDLSLTPQEKWEDDIVTKQRLNSLKF